MGERKIDKVNHFALQNWNKVNKKRKAKKGKTKRERPRSGEINDLRKIVKLYKVYGNDNLALVNPVNNPGILQVRKRSAERRMIERQMGLAENHFSYNENYLPVGLVHGH